MQPLEIAFWLLAGMVLYTYVGYPVLLAVAVKLARKRSTAAGPPPRSVSVVVCAHNEVAAVERRLAELTELLYASGFGGEVILVSDGSDDATAERARAFAGRGVRVLETPGRVGKAAALSYGCKHARGEILVVADARQTWAADALARLLAAFADPTVGAVSGDLVLESAPGTLAGVGVYWHFEKWLRRMEAAVGSQVGVTGAIAAVRRELFRPIPAGTVLDDVYWPMQVVLQGYRVVNAPGARAYDRLPARPRDEFRRKVRTLGGNFQLCAFAPELLLPWRNPIWLQFVSHKLLRLAVPWALVALLPVTAALPGGLYAAALAAQLAFYGLGLLGMVPAVARRCRPASFAASFLVLNSAAFVAFWVWALGRSERSWSKVLYDHRRPADAARGRRAASL